MPISPAAIEIDDLAVFDRELTESEARAVYSLPKGIAELGANRR